MEFDEKNRVYGLVCFVGIDGAVSSHTGYFMDILYSRELYQ